MHNWKIMSNFATANTKHDGVLAHLVERNTGSVEVSGSSPLYSTIKSAAFRNQVKSGAFLLPTPQVPIAKGACILIPPAASKYPNYNKKVPTAISRRYLRYFNKLILILVTCSKLLQRQRLLPLCNLPSGCYRYQGSPSSQRVQEPTTNQQIERRYAYGP